MPVDTIHPQAKAHAGQWQRCRDAIAGQDAVHGGNERYLPKLKEQSQEEYRAYRDRTPWYGATGRTLDGLVGMVFRKAPVLEAPAALAAFAEDITLGGVTLDGLARDITREVIGIGRVGALVEYPQVVAQPSSLAQASAQNLRPYATLYKAESIRNWACARVNNAMQPVLVVLDEVAQKPVDEFESEPVPQIRVLLLEEGRYVQRLYQKADSGEWTLVAQLVPTKMGAPLNFIPFYPFGPEANTLDCQQSPVLDLVDLNISHYKSSADLEHGAHFTGLPMLFLAGVQLNEGESVYLGSQKAVVAPDPQADGKYIEFAGQGLSALETRCEKKEQQMAALGARMLAPEKHGVEAEGALQMRHSGEDSVLAGMAALVESGVTKMLAFMAEWAGISGTVTYSLNKDYLPAGMTAQELTALVGAWQQGGISWNTLFAKLKQGEVIDAQITEEEEQARIGDQPPVMQQLMAQPTPVVEE